MHVTTAVLPLPTHDEPSLDNNDEKQRNFRKRSISLGGSRPDSKQFTTRLCFVATQSPESNSSTRPLVGGKCTWLETMRDGGLPVPAFQSIDIKTLSGIERQAIDLKSLEAFNLTAFAEGLKGSPVTLKKLREHITSLDDKALTKVGLDALSKFIGSDLFYKQIKESMAAKHIRLLHSMLIPPYEHQLNVPIIVRSSGLAEDDYGDAQAGKYESIVHNGKDDIVKTYLKVIASSYRPEVCSINGPQPMAVVLQKCIDCSFGGVVMSHTSLKDNTMLVEYAPGQPKTAVAGQFGIKPHQYTLSQGSDGKVVSSFSEGDVSDIFVLQQAEGSYREVSEKVKVSESITLDQRILDQLYQHSKTLENTLQCPVDVEFGIDHSGQIYLLQVRPITRLIGDMNFSMKAPVNPVATGTLMSEGYCSGAVKAVNSKRELMALPERAIIFANYSSDWMLEPDCLKRAGGFIFKYGGVNDHVSITLRQAGKPCLLAPDFVVSKTVESVPFTLMCGAFAGESGAYLLKGDQRDKVQDKSKGTSNFSLGIKAAKEFQPVKVDFVRPDTVFLWLNRQNERLLAYFGSERLLNRCLSPEGSVQLSMSPQRKAVLDNLKLEVGHLFQDAEKSLAGFERFLQLDKNQNTFWLEECKELKQKLRCLKINALTQFADIYHGSISRQPSRLQALDFRKWTEDCKRLQNSLQTLHLPENVNAIGTVHDLIYFVHKSFVDALPSVAVGSGMGKVDFDPLNPTVDNYVDFLKGAKESQSSGFLNDACKKAIEELNCRYSTTVNMTDALIVNAKLGIHLCIIQLLENAEGGKGRTLKLKFSDPDVEDKPYYPVGKKNRMLFIVHLLTAASINKDAGGCEIKFDENLWELQVDLTHFKMKGAMQESFKKLLSVLSGLQLFDGDCNSLYLNTINDSLDISDHDFEYLLRCGDENMIKRVFPNLNENYRNNKETIEFFIRKGMPWIIKYAGDELRSNKEFLLSIINKYPASIKFINISNELKNDKMCLLNAIKLNGSILKYVDEDLKKDKHFVLAAVRVNNSTYDYANSLFRRDAAFSSVLKQVHYCTTCKVQSVEPTYFR